MPKVKHTYTELLERPISELKKIEEFIQDCLYQKQKDKEEKIRKILWLESELEKDD